MSTLGSRRALVFLMAAVAGPTWLAGAAEPKRPNVLFIAVDDLRPELNCYGATHIKSPHLDRLAASGTLFQRAYCQQAVCSPSRTSLLTGLRPDSTQVYDLQTHFRRQVPDVVTLPQHFKQQGYHAEAMGKIYHGGLDDAASWSVPLWNAQPARRRGAGDAAAPGANASAARTPQELEQQARQQQAARRNAPRGPAWAAPDVADNELADGRMAEHAVERLQQLSRTDKPFFLAVGFHKPHLPFIAPRKYFNLYDPRDIRLADNPYHPRGANEYTLTNSGELRSYDGVPKQGNIPDEMARQLKHAYYACVSYLDANVGQVLDELDRLKLRENTIVILWGDHGWKLGEHGEWCKHSNVEKDTRSTLLVSAPGLPRGQKTNSLVEFVDIYPTLCDLAGLSQPAHLEGASMLPMLKEPFVQTKSAAISQYPRGKVMGYSLRTDRFRFTRWASRDKPHEALAVELYDHQTDPAENVNIAADPAQAELVKQLTGRLQLGWRGALVMAEQQPVPKASTKTSPVRNAANDRQMVYVSLGASDLVSAYRLNVQTGGLEKAGQATVGKGPGAQAVDPRSSFLYVSVRGDKTVAALKIDSQTGQLSLRGSTPLVSDAAYLAVDATGKHLLMASYGAGKIGIYPIRADGTVGDMASTVQTTDKNPHSIRTDPSNRFLYVPNTGADKILQFSFNPEQGTLAPLTPPHVDTEPGTGPRHFWFHPKLNAVYFVNEKSSSVTLFGYDTRTGLLAAEQSISTLPSDFSGQNTCAHIEATADGKYLYASNRGHDSLAIYAIDPTEGRLSLVGHQATEKTPRSFAIDATAQYLFAAGQGTTRLAAYRIDAPSGKLGPLTTYEVGNGPAWVQVVRLPAVE